MSARSRVSMLMSALRVLERLPLMLLARQVILLSLLLGSTMGMRGAILQFICPLVILVM